MSWRCKACLAQFASLKCLLIVSFILLMTAAGFLGYFLTDIQSRRSLNEVTELGVHDQVVSILELISTQLERGHSMIIQEIRHFTNRGVYLNDWVVIWELWRPFTIDLIATAPDWFPNTGLLWLPNHAVTFTLALKTAIFLNFNNTICTDLAHFPRSNCSVFGMESYPLDSSWQPIWSSPLGLNLQFNLTQQSYWKTGVMSRLDKWRANKSANPYNLGYAAITPFYQVSPPALNLQMNGNLMDRNGEVVGQITKSLQMTFLTVYLQKLTTNHKLFINEGRAFSFELGNGLLTGASHGRIYALETTGIMRRFTPSMSSDPIIAAAGKALSESTSIDLSYKLQFSAVGKRFLFVAEPLQDPYGLAWMACVVLSLTDLFQPMNDAALRMLGWTALAVILLSLVAGLLISFLVIRPLHQLAHQMRNVSNMDLDLVDGRCYRSVFIEIIVMQDYFYKMVENLKEYRAFLPAAILDAPEPLPRRSLTSTSGPFFNRTRTTNSAASDRVQPNNEYNAPTDSVTKPANGPGFDGPRASESSGEGSRHSPNPNREGRPRGRLSVFMVANDHECGTQPLGHNSAIRLGGLTKRMVSMLMLDMQGCHRWMAQVEGLVKLHSSALRRANEIILKNEGMSTPFMGDKLMVFWNVRVVKADHATICVTTAMQLFARLNRLKTQGAHGNIAETEAPDAGVGGQKPIGGVPSLPSSAGTSEVTPQHPSSPDVPPLSSSGVTFRIACSMGVACFGTMGTQASRAFTILSPCVPRAVVLQKLGKLIPFGVVCDGAVHERVQYHFVTRLVGLLAYPDRAPEHRVYEVTAIKTKEGKADEWMYELRQQQESCLSANSQNSNDPLGLRAIYSEATTGRRNSPAAVLIECQTPFPQLASPPPPIPQLPTPPVGPTPPLGTASSQHMDDPVASFYRTHAEDLRRLVHPNWGLGIPLQLWLSITSTGGSE